MDIFEVLRADHAEIRSLLNEVIHQTSAPMPAEKRLDHFEDWEEVLHDFKLSLIGHNRAEELILYRLLRPTDGEFYKSKTHEHQMAEARLSEFERINPRDRNWSDLLGLLKNQIESHQAEEETTTFERLAPEVDPIRSEQMAREFIRLRDDIIESAGYHPRGRSVINPNGLNLQS